MTDNINLVYLGDIGSFEVTEVNQNKISLMGKSTDVGKLPTGSKLATGSSALCLDTGDLYLYSRPENQWYKM